MAMSYRPLAFYRETCVFPPVAREKPLEVFKPFLVYFITLVRPTNLPKLVEIGLQVATPRSGEMSRFRDFCSPFYIFPYPHLTYRSQFWTNSHALWLKRSVLFWTRAFPGFQVFKFTFRGSPVQNTKISTRFWIAAEIALALEPSRVNYP